MRAILLAGVLAGTVGLASQAEATFIETGVETSSGVVFTGTGSINLAGLASDGNGNASSAGIIPQYASFIVNGFGNAYTGLSGPASLGLGGYTAASSQTGNSFVVSGSQRSLLVPTGYVSGSALSNSLTFAGATFASLGLTQGFYNYTFGSGATADNIGFQIGAAAAVPEPASLSLLGIGVAGVAAVRRKWVG